MRRCTKCRVQKPPADFYLTKGYRNGACKVCVGVRGAKRYQANRAAIKAQHRKYYLKNKKRLLERDVWRNRARRTGFTRAHYQTALSVQGNKCGICMQPLTVLPSRRIAADHCHATNTPRGILCSHCNHGLGYFKDSPVVLINAAYYLINPPLGRA